LTKTGPLCRKKVQLKIWDRFLVPKPLFSGDTIRFGEMIRLAFTEDQEERERQRQYLETIMARHLQLQ